MVSPTGLFRSFEEVRGKPVREWGTRNGVNVEIVRDENGSNVAADCQCFGFERQLHSNQRCPLFIRQSRGL
jgi:hypothetical protein